jgi:sensor histidine kinase regulating citrate/malate metabolism
MEGLLTDGHKENAENYLTELKGELDEIPVLVRTSHPIVDAVLTSYLQRANQSGISVQMDVRLPNEITVPAVDLCVLIGNAVDNAINACELLSEDHSKKISIAIYQKDLSLLIEVKNSYSPNLKQPKERASHGLGLKNIENVAKRNNGFFEITSDTDTFCISIIIHNPVTGAP